VSTDDGRFTHRPGTVRNAGSLAFATVTTGLVAPTSSVALVVCAVGALGLAVGLTRGDRRIAGGGSFLLLCGAFAAGALGAPPVRLLPAVATAIIAWDLGTSGFAAGHELAGGRVERAELLDVVTATAVGAAVTAATYLFYRVVTVGVSVVAVFFLLVAVVALGLALRER